MGKQYNTAPISRLHELFEVRGGGLYRRVRQGKAAAGARAGGPHNAGYERVRVDGEYFLVHRVVFALVHGRWPESDVDHRNGSGVDNAPSNIREASHAQNMRNGKGRKNNTSGAPGVSWDTSRGKWAVTISHNGRTRHFGRHDDFEFADLVAQEARTLLFGEFAPARN